MEKKLFDAQVIVASLRSVGLWVTEFSWAAAAVPAVAARIFSALPEDGRVDVHFPLDDPALNEHGNAAWWRLALDYDLFDVAEREFLVSVGPEDGELPAEPHWARVRLEDDWDILGRVCNGVLGGPPGRPGFVMMALDESVLIGGTTWQDSISIMALPDPIRASSIRRFLHLDG